MKKFTMIKIKCHEYLWAFFQVYKEMVCVLSEGSEHIQCLDFKVDLVVT